MTLTLVDGGLSKVKGSIPCRTEIGDIWELGDGYVVVGQRRPKFMSSRVATTYIGGETANGTVEEYQADLKLKRIPAGSIIEDFSKMNTGNLWLACLLEGIMYRGYTVEPEIADLMLQRAEFMLKDTAIRLS